MATKTKKKKNRYRLGIVIIVSLFILIVSFVAYMNNTTLEDVLNDKYDNNIVVHQDDYAQNQSSWYYDEIKFSRTVLNSPFSIDFFS